MKVIQYSNNMLQKFKALEIPTPIVLCIAAILGSICNFIAVTNVYSAYDKDVPNSSEFLLIVPAKPQIHVSLPLPAQHPKKATL